jgi:hypothetical protein
MVDDSIEGSVAVPRPISQGFAYQIEHFLDRALRMLAEPELRMTAVELENDEAAGVEDVVVEYEASIDDPDRPAANVEYIQVKYKASSRAILRGASFVDLREWGGKTVLLEKMSRWWQKSGKRSDVRLTLVTDAARDTTDPFFECVSRERGTIAATFLTDPKMKGLREQWQDAAGLDEADFASFVRCLRIDARGDSIEAMRERVLATARGIGMRGAPLGPAITAVGEEIFHSRARRYTPARLLVLLAARGIAPSRLPPRMIEPKRATAVPLAARIDERSGSLTLDVGTVWGLQTGRFLGLLEGGTPERVHEALCAAQSALELLGETDRRREWWLATGFGWYDPASILTAMQSSDAIGVVVEALPIEQHLPFLHGLTLRLFADRQRDVSLVLTFDPSAAPVVTKFLRELRVKGIEIPVERLTVVETLSGAAEEEVIATAASADRTQLAAGLARAATWDRVLERWLLAFGLTRADELYDLCSRPDPDQPAAVGRVALALMRILANGVEAAAVRRALERLAPLLDAATLRVARWSMKGDPMLAELDDDAAARVLLPRAGIGAHVLEIRPHSFDISDAFVAQANMPAPDHVGALLRLRSGQRAVVGLCSAAEWRGVRAAASEELTFLRHGRPLPAVPNLIAIPESTTERPD